MGLSLCSVSCYPKGGGEGIKSSISYQLTGFWVPQREGGWESLRVFSACRGEVGVVILTSSLCGGVL